MEVVAAEASAGASGPGPGTGRRCCVTGATGFLGSWVVKLALEDGWEVVATTRREASAPFLRALPGASARLRVVAGCDLLKPGSFDDAIRGCEVVVHTASPFFLLGGDEEQARKRLLEPAVDGTREVLSACARLQVRKVVLTSSMAAVYAAQGRRAPDYAFSSADWSNAEALERARSWYPLSKTLAERQAWALTELSGIRLAVMNPCLILGPMLRGQQELNTSCMNVLRLFSGERTCAKACMHVVDVRDVARGHMVAAAAPDHWPGWGRRFVLVGASEMQRVLVDALRRSPAVPPDMKQRLPAAESEALPPVGMGAPPGHVTRFDLAPSLSPPQQGGLGLRYHALQEMMNDTVEAMLANGFTSADMYRPGN